jgi:hypothetical protein
VPASDYGGVAAKSHDVPHPPKYRMPVEEPTAPQPTPRSETVPASRGTVVETSEPRRVRTQIEQPSQANPGGRIAEGWCKVEGGILPVEDMQGNILGRQPVKVGDDVGALARKILREKTRSGAEIREGHEP